MKHIFLLMLIITTIRVNGQKHFAGLKAGVNWSNVTATNFINDRNFRTGFAAGLTYDYRFKKHFTAGADIIYDQRGLTSKINFTDDFGNPTGQKATVKFNYNYISIPLKAGFNYGKTIYGFANIGVIPSLLLDARTILPIISLTGRVTPGEITLNVTDRVNKFDIAGLVEVGGGYKFKERYWLYSSFSYQHSFTSITNPDYYAHSAIRHYGMTLNLGLKYALAKK